MRQTTKKNKNERVTLCGKGVIDIAKRERRPHERRLAATITRIVTEWDSWKHMPAAVAQAKASEPQSVSG